MNVFNKIDRPREICNPAMKLISNCKTIIVMGTYNGERYLSEQIDSLIAQSEKEWMLLINDDGSSDRTVSILERYSKQDERIQLIAGNDSNVGSTLKNFDTLLRFALCTKAEYFFTCDQDDIWDPKKLQRMLAKIKQIEGADKLPTLVHHDLRVVDKYLKVISPSFVRMMNILPEAECAPQRLLSRNEVTGCAMTCNRTLLEMALPISDQAIMHDWWLALFAAHFGKLRFEPQALVDYRQHGSNVIGAKSTFHGLNPFTNWVEGWRRGNLEFLETVEQAQAFKQLAAERELDAKLRVFLELYSTLPYSSRLQRIKRLHNGGFWRSHWLLNVVLVFRMLLLPKTRKI